MTRHIVLVLGIARSGTSVTAGVLSRLGIEFGSGLKPADHRNPTGFYEDFVSSRLNQRLLIAFERTWSDHRALPDGWVDHPETERTRRDLGRHIGETFGAATAIGLKDPRIVRLLPLYLRVSADLDRTSWLVVVRRPRDAVIESIRRSGYYHGSFSVAAAHRLYDAYLQDIAAHHVPERTVTLDYSEILDDIGAVIERFAGFFPFPVKSYDEVADELASYVDRELCHHRNHRKLFSLVGRKLGWALGPGQVG